MLLLHVIIPVYNCKKYLEEAVTSVVSQCGAKAQIILVDDGSTDGSNLLCDQLSEANESVCVIHKQNGGVSSARNTGIHYILEKHAGNLSGRYIAFLDADDVWEQNFLDAAVVERLDHSYDLLGYQICKCNKHLQSIEEPRKIQQEGTVSGGENNVWSHSTQSFASMFYSCEFLQKYNIRFTEGLKYSEDKMFSLRCMYLADRVWLENKVMYLYRVVATSAMGRRKFGIPYYQPIIDAYLEMDREMECWANPVRGRMIVGRLCASRYAVYMLEEHFQNWRSKKAMDCFWEEHPKYIAIMKRQPPYEFLPRNMTYEAYENNPEKFIFKNNLLGVGKFIRRMLARIIKRLY